MSDSMYRSKRKFTREQLVFVVECAFASAFDRIESQLPPCVPLDEYTKHKVNIGTFYDGINEMLGMTLAVLIAQLTGDGCGIFDWFQAPEWEAMVVAFIKERTDPAYKGYQPGDKCHPDCREIAERFVDQNLPFAFKQ
jgi:hypothetical protein